MQTFGVVVDAPFLNDHSRLFETVEDRAVGAFVPELCPVVTALLQSTGMISLAPEARHSSAASLQSALP